MNGCLVIDASVAIKWYLLEIHAGAALEYLDERFTLIVPELFFAEFGNILWKKSRLGEISIAEAHGILDEIERVPLQQHDIHSLLKPAFELATVHNSSVYDCVYLALAVTGGCQMVTADRKFFDKVVSGEYSGSIQWVEEGMSR
mgnify:FL=1